MTHIREVGTIAVPVTDPERALAFYAGTLGLEVRRDVPFGQGARWIEVARPERQRRSRWRPPVELPAASTRGSASRPVTARPTTGPSSAPESLSARSCAGPASRRCSACTTRTGTPCTSWNSRRVEQRTPRRLPGRGPHHRPAPVPAYLAGAGSGRTRACGRIPGGLARRWTPPRSRGAVGNARTRGAERARRSGSRG